MIPKPKHLEEEYGAQFQDESIIAAYQYRPLYPEGVFDILAGLISDEPDRMLDAGCGTGDIARLMVGRVAHVDAVDISAGMLQKGQSLPGGNSANLRWINAKIEEAALEPPYALITAGESLHWFDWAAVFPRFAQMLTPNGFLACIERTIFPPVLSQEIVQIITRYSTNHDFKPYNLFAELDQRNLFEKFGEEKTKPELFVQ